MIIACATDNGKQFTPRHFGDANYYYIYKLDGQNFIHIDTITNTSEEERQHADPKKAKNIISLLKDKSVNVALTKNFGPNIKRIKEHLVPVIVSVDDIDAGLAHLKDASILVIEAVNKTEDRVHIDLRKH